MSNNSPKLKSKVDTKTSSADQTRISDDVELTEQALERVSGGFPQRTKMSEAKANLKAIFTPGGP